MTERCAWVGEDPLYIHYHDTEWGVPCRDAHTLFEGIVLEGAQAGLSWITILRKREAYRKAFAGFDPERVARFTPKDVERLMQDAGIVRNRAKIESAIGNAQAWLALREREDPVQWLWEVAVDGRIITNRHQARGDVPVSTPESDRLSRELKRAGFRFVGTTTCYAFMQATGMVNDHFESCFRHGEVGQSPLPPSRTHKQ
ncbi:DNA-3-methyladenine glycosylase I [Niveibacterium sp. SC-1]|uniref:DNA-3-methyladenine glycosylase I n=1 Tax=Niveibacterium sp. SC-1 TaxID=3135646 RepID=UPI00311EC295